MSRPQMAHEGDPRGNPLHAPVTRLEFYVVILVAVGTKALPFVVPAATALSASLWP